MNRRINYVLSDARRAGGGPGGPRMMDLGAPGAGGPGPGLGRMEAIILLDERPALLVRKNRIEMPRSGAWADTLAAYAPLLEARLPSVGRIEVDDGTGYHHFGTGWVIADGVIATNSHVARVFAGKTAGGGVFLANWSGEPYRARIDFLQEYEEPGAFEVNVREVVFMQDADPTLPDIALLRLAAHGNLPAPIPLLETPSDPGALLAVVGYPAFDPRYGLDAAEAARAVFGTVYEVKRLSPGRVIAEEAAPWAFTHDATTLGGNSGSVVLDIETGYASGMHFQGDFLHANHAVRGDVLLDQAARSGLVATTRRPLPAVAPGGVPAEPEAVAELPAESYADRSGYDPKFLGGAFVVPMPALRAATKRQVLKFEDPVTGKQASELKYTHFSVVMHKARRMCLFSAVNIDGTQSVAIKGRRPGWRFDPRIPKAEQVKDECYGKESAGKFSRGHMTRREDPNWGPDAERANWDTFHVTNATPQIQPFNAGVWLSLEDYALENADQDDMHICVFTGPIFTPDDPEYFGVGVPVRFWKVITFIHDQTGKLSATGYTMSQRDLLPGAEFVFGRFQTYQTALKEIEGLTGLSFGRLAALDPMRVVEEAPPAPLRSLEEIRFA